jgi:hypothetical protein
MVRRIKLHIDKLIHMNDVVFDVFRSTEPGVDENDLHVMSVDDSLAIKQTYSEVGEILERDAYTPYAFLSKRHFNTIPYPKVTMGSLEVDTSDVVAFPNEKTIEIHSGDIGLFDGRTIYMDYEYDAIPVLDDTVTESGKDYVGPPATGLRPPLSFTAEQDIPNRRIHLSFLNDTEPVNYFYRIFARDTDGNRSPWSDEHVIAMNPAETFFRIERSKDEEDWEDVSFSNMIEWYDDLLATDKPKNVQNALIIPMNSKESKLILDNPWYHWMNYIRKSYTYRVRAEDSDGLYTDWIYFGPMDIFIEPEEVLIRRKRDNGQVSSKTQTDAIDVFRLRKEDVGISSPTITLIDDQLTDATIYSYTFFLQDIINMEAVPMYKISDHTPWANIILFSGEEGQDAIADSDFLTTFELADKIIEIGDKEA